MKTNTSQRIHVHRSLGLSVGAMLLLCLPSLVGCATEGVTLPSYFKDGETPWERAYEADGIVEMVRSGQTLDDWTELLTIQTFDKDVLVGSIDEMVDAHQKRLIERCPGSTFGEVQRSPNSILFESNIVGSDAPDEQNVSRILDGEQFRFFIIYAVREPLQMTEARKTDWIERLSNAFVTMR